MALSLGQSYFQIILLLFCADRRTEDLQRIKKFFMMFTQTIFYDTQDLPSDVLSLIDHQFYDFVQGRLGENQQSLLKLQEINSVPCFLLTNDPWEVLNLNIDDIEVNLLKKHVCFSLSEGSFVVKPGIRTSFKCLRDILTKKIEQKLKQTRAMKPHVTTGNATDSSPSSLVSTLPVAIIAPKLSLASISFAPNLTSTSIIEHKRYFIDRSKRWCSDYEDDFSIDGFNLQEREDFFLNVSVHVNGDVEATVRCKCESGINLPIKQRKIQLSNFQKYLRATHRTHMRAMQKKNEEQRDKQTQESTNVPSLTDAIDSSSPIKLNQLIVPSPIVLSTRASSTFITPTADARISLSSIVSRKRALTSSPSSPSQRTKRSRAWCVSLIGQDFIFLLED
jgi:hypothetical protein